MSWTDERIATLRKMWEGGATASEIATELGGVSRNAVIGKAHRLGLKARPSPVKANEKKKTAAPAPKKPAAPAPTPARSTFTTPPVSRAGTAASFTARSPSRRSPLVGIHLPQRTSGP